MPEQPINKAEEMLQRHARQRRERGGDFALHPATRRLLQGEVTRQLGGAARSESSGTFASWFTAWRGLSLACSILVLLGVGAWMISRHSAQIGRTETQLAKTEPPARAPAPALKPLLGKEPLADELATMPAQKKLSDPLAATPPPAAAPAAPAPREKLVARKDADAATGPVRELAANSPIASTAQKSETSLRRKVGEFESVDKRARDLGKTSDAPVMNYSIAGTPADRANLALKEQQSPAVVADALSQNTSPAAASRQAGNTTQNLPISRGGAQQLLNGGLAGQQQLRSGINNEGSTTLANNTYYNRQLQNQTAPGAAPQLSLGRPDQRQESDAPPQFALEPAARQRRSEILSEFRAGLETKQAAPAVLEHFSIEQIGSIVRVTDADGSLYQGSFFTEEPSAPDERLSPKGGAQLMTMNRYAVVAPRRLGFHASGTNRTLNQLVVVNGRFIDSGTNIGAFVASAPAAKSLEREQTAQVVPAQSAIPQTIPPRGFVFRKASGPVVAPTNSVNAVEGTVRVGDSAERPFHAQRVTR